MSVKVILDTNFLLIPAQFGVDIYSEIRRICDYSYELVVLKESLFELDRIINTQKGKDKAAAKMALALLSLNKVKILEFKTAMFKNVDKIILEIASKERVIVATQDKILRTALKKSHSRVIVLRSKKFLKLEDV